MTVMPVLLMLLVDACILELVLIPTRIAMMVMFVPPILAILRLELVLTLLNPVMMALLVPLILVMLGKDVFTLNKAVVIKMLVL
jgi:hypothetical protein